MSKDLRRKKVKKRKILKKIGLSILAGFMFCLPVLGAACTPLLALPENEIPPVLALDPATDPTVYTTQQGLEIKKSNGYISSSVATTTNRGTSYTQDLSGFYYFTMGSFSGTIYTAKTQTDTYTVTNEPVNWLIIGRGEFDFYDDTPAGSDIQNDVNDQEIALQGCYLPMSMSVIPQNEEIPKNSFLVLSEKLLGNMYFNSGGAINWKIWTEYSYSYFLWGESEYGNRYRYIGSVNTNKVGAQSWNTSSNTGGSLYNYINNLFSKNASTGEIISNQLNFTQAQANMVLPQQLYTYYSNGTGYNYQETPETDGGTYYSMFPLAYGGANSSIYQNFCIENYLTSNAKRISVLIKSSSNQTYAYYLRSGCLANICTVVYNIFPSGEIYSNYPRGCQYGHGVRPAFVLSLAI